jgi:hypothetical protein
MKHGFKFLTGLLAILGIGDLAIVPSMIAANHHTEGTPPMPAIVATVIIGIATLVSAAGIARGWKRAFAVAMTCRIIDGISSALGLLARPSALLVTTGALGVVLSVAAIVLLVRLSPRRVLRRAASGSASDRQPELSSGPALIPAGTGFAEQTASRRPLSGPSSPSQRPDIPSLPRRVQK